MKKSRKYRDVRVEVERRGLVPSSERLVERPERAADCNEAAEGIG